MYGPRVARRKVGEFDADGDGEQRYTYLEELSFEPLGLGTSGRDR
jgi:hypothetical protein